MEAINLVQQAANLNGTALVGVLDRALRSPNVYYFSELLNLPNVKAVRIIHKYSTKKALFSWNQVYIIFLPFFLISTLLSCIASLNGTC
jgi:hypothetical protein